MGVFCKNCKYFKVFSNGLYGRQYCNAPQLGYKSTITDNNKITIDVGDENYPNTIYKNQCPYYVKKWWIFYNVNEN